MSWFSRTFFGKGLQGLADKFYPFHYWGAAPQFNDYTEDSAKLLAIFSNPALLKVFSLQCDLFSLGRPYVYGPTGSLKPKDDAIKRIENPNPMQTMQDWLWSYMFWKMAGNAYLYMSSKVVTRDNAPMYWLENHKIEWPMEIDKNKDKLILSEAKLKRLLTTPLKYRYEDGSSMDFTLGDLEIIPDLTNGTGNWFKGFSRIDALRKVISNSEEALDSKNTNLRYSRKFLVAGKQDPADVTKKPMHEDEKQTIEQRIDSDKKHVHAMKSMVDIKRFVDDLKVLELDKAYLADYYIIGAAYNIPRDVLEAYQSSTFENQEKARAGHVTYTLEPAGEVLGAALADAWDYTKYGWKICFGWDHLPFTQVFEKERVNIKQSQVNIFLRLLDYGMKLEDINAYLDTDFKLDEDAIEQATAAEPAEKAGRTKAKGYGKRYKSQYTKED